MGTKTKLLGGAAVLAASVAAGAFYANNYVIPEQMAADIDAAFQDMYSQKQFGTDLQVAATGGVTVTPNGFLTYDVTLPGFEFSGTDEDITIAGGMESENYQLTITDMAAAALSLVNEDQVVEATMVSVNPVDTTFAVSDGNGSGFFMNMTCDEVTHDAQTLAGRYSVVTDAAACTVSGVMNDGELKQLDITATMTAGTTVSNMDGGNYDVSSSMTMNDMVFNIYDTYNGEVEISVLADSLSFDVGYDGLSADARSKEVEELSVADLPDSINFAFEVEGLTAEGEDMLVGELPVLDLNVEFGASALQSDSASVTLSYGYDVAGLENIDPFMRPNVPTSSECGFAFGNIPAQGLGQTVIDSIEETGDFGFAGPIIAEEAIDQVSETEGVSVELDCAASTGDLYSSTIEADHTFMGEAFPGSGRIEVYGFDEVMNELAGIIGAQAFQLTGLFTTFAVPTEDGEGMMLEYELDEGGMLTVNGQPLGPVLQP